MPVKQPRRLSKGDGTTKQIVEHHKAVHCTLEFPGLQEGSKQAHIHWDTAQLERELAQWYVLSAIT